MYISGVKEYDKQGREMKTCCIFGRAIRDGEIKQTSNGKHIATISVKAYSKRDGSAEFVSVKAWDGPFLNAIGNTQKGDSMMVCGTLNEREYNGKNYVDLMADFYLRVPADGSQAENFTALNKRVETFNAINEDDGELPF